METIDTTAAFRAAAHAQHGMAGSVLSRALAGAVEALRLVPTTVSDYRALDEGTLLSLNTLNAEAARLGQWPCPRFVDTGLGGFLEVRGLV